MVTKDEVRRALDRLALSGGNVCIHSSLRTLGGPHSLRPLGQDRRRDNGPGRRWRMLKGL